MSAYERYFGQLPIGILLLSEKFVPVYSNRTYRDLMELGAAEFGSWERAHENFLEGARRFQNKPTAVIRFLVDGGKDSVVISVAQTKFEPTASTRNLKLLSLILRGPARMARKEITDEIYIYGVLRVNIPNQTAFIRRNLLPLTLKEFQLLSFFCRNEDKLLTKRDLLLEVWQQRSSGTRTVDVFVSRLRRKLKAAGVKQNYIRTVHGSGYIFTP